MFEAESQQPGNFSLDVQDRMGGVQLLLQPSHFRLELVHLRAEGVALGGLPTALARGQALKRPLTPRPCAIPSDGSCTAPRGEAAGPPRRAACSSLPPPESAVDTARRTCASFGLATTSGSDGGFASRAPAPGASSLRSSPPRAGASHRHPGHRLSLCTHRVSPSPPYTNSKGHRCRSDVGREGWVVISSVNARDQTRRSTGCSTRLDLDSTGGTITGSGSR